MNLSGKPAGGFQNLTGQLSEPAILPLWEQRFHRTSLPVNFPLVNMYASALLHILKIFPKVIDLRKLRCQGGVQFVEQGRQVSPNNWCALPSPPRCLNGERSKSSGSMLMAVAMWSRIKSSHASCSALNLTPAFALSMSHSLNRSDTESAKGARMGCCSSAKRTSATSRINLLTEL